MKQRERAIHQLQRDGGSICTFGERPFFGPPVYHLDTPDGLVGRTSRVRQLLGDMTVDHIVLPSARFDREGQLVKKYPYESSLRELFPEAQVIASDAPHYH